MARIALVHDVAGVATVQAEILRRVGHDVDHIRLSDFGASWPWPAKAATLPVRILRYMPTVRRLREGGYDAIHIHWVSRGIIGLLAGKPFLIQAHGSDVHLEMKTPGVSRLNRRVMEDARVIFYVTPNLAPLMEPFRDKLRYLPNPVQVGEGARPPERVRRLLIFTRLDPVKGVDRIFPALERLSRSVEVTALAWGPLAGEYSRRYGKFARFVEVVPRDQVGVFLDRFDLVVGQMRQGVLGLSELEAMAAGRPVVTAVERGLYPDDPPPVIEAADPDGLVEQVELLRDDGERLAELSRAGREWVRRNHGYERHLEILESAYSLASPRVSGTPIAM